MADETEKKPSVILHKKENKTGVPQPQNQQPKKKVVVVKRKGPAAPAGLAAKGKQDAPVKDGKEKFRVVVKKPSDSSADSKPVVAAGQAEERPAETPVKPVQTVVERAEKPEKKEEPASQTGSSQSSQDAGQSGQNKGRSQSSPVPFVLNQQRPNVRAGNLSGYGRGRGGYGNYRGGRNNGGNNNQGNFTGAQAREGYQNRQGGGYGNNQNRGGYGGQNRQGGYGNNQNRGGYGGQNRQGGYGNGQNRGYGNGGQFGGGRPGFGQGTGRPDSFNSPASMQTNKTPAKKGQKARVHARQGEGGVL